jgi:flagellar hook-length control protein FliK
VPVENPAAAAAANESSATQPDEKQIETKVAAASEDNSSPDRPRVAAASRATSLNPTVPVAANVDPSQPAAAAPPNAAESDFKPQEIKPAAKEGLLSPFTRLERGGPLNSHANRPIGDREAAPHVDPARFVSRVARAVQTAHERGGPLQLRLSPPELGTMRLELAVHEGALSAKIETDNATARQVLLDNLPALRDRLAEQNVRIERFDVDVRRDGTGDGSGRPNPGPQERGHHRHGEPTPHRTNTGRGTTSQTTSDTPSPIRRTITDTTINLVI